MAVGYTVQTGMNSVLVVFRIFILESTTGMHCLRVVRTLVVWLMFASGNSYGNRARVYHTLPLFLGNVRMS